MASDRGFIERPRSFCAMGGALVTVGSIPGAVPILHAAAGCAGSVYWNQLGTTGYLGSGYCGGLSVPSSNVGEHEVIFGGDDRLSEQIANTLKVIDGRLFVVITGCMSDIIGEDVRAAARGFRAEGWPVVGVETGGFKGDGYAGYDLVLSALFNELPTVELPPESGKSKNKRIRRGPRVNLLGIVPGQDPFWRGNLRHLRVLLSKLGLEVETFFASDSSPESLADASNADLTIVASPAYGHGAASALELDHGVPQLTTAFPVGPTLTGAFVREVGDRLGISARRVARVIAEEEREYYLQVERIADAYNDLDMQRYAVVVGDANYAPALSRFLADDLGWLPKVSVISGDNRTVPVPAAEALLSNFASGFETRVVYENDASRVAQHLSDAWKQDRATTYHNAFSPAFVVGSHLEREFARSIGAGHLSVSYPVGNRVVLSRGYAGYAGALTLIEDLLSVLVAER